MEKVELHIPFTEKLKSIPDFFGIRLNETPAYEVLEKDGDFEKRLYSKQLRAKITLRSPDFDAFRERAFERLAAYIFGGNAKKTDMAMTSPTLQQMAERQSSSEDIAMTSPVLQQNEGEEAWSMSFILPSEYNLDKVPQPIDAQIQIEEVEPYEVASVAYSGDNTTEKIKENEIRLATWMAGRPGFKRDGKFFSAQYDAPFVIPFFKRNEIQIKIVRSH